MAFLQPLPKGSSQPRSIVFLTSIDGSLLLATTNSGSNDITIFRFEAGMFTKVESYRIAPWGN